MIREQLEELLDLIDDLEWVGGKCPSCYIQAWVADTQGGHRPPCRLQAALVRYGRREAPRDPKLCPNTTEWIQKLRHPPFYVCSCGAQLWKTRPHKPGEADEGLSPAKPENRAERGPEAQDGASEPLAPTDIHGPLAVDVSEEGDTTYNQVRRWLRGRGGGLTGRGRR